MDSKILSDVACGVFRLRMDDPHMNESTVVDVHDDDYTTLTTVEVRSGTVVLHCLASQEMDEDDEDEDEDDNAGETATDEASDDADDAIEDADEDEDGDDEEPVGKTYTLSSGNSVTVRATAVRLVPVGMETAEGVYQVQMMKALD
jgi:hypothetical protein